ncbi:hypothetical protein HZS55_10145 [Halosimplex rubrum]|uniref:Uncharacterized protein n=1 Tax=Halosimplex rubrum TaxID=869889 RepID=A0A7D5P505_9EURY|nr:hypothetical protein [Halosimplex rubrum]QLH77638.1 hypothetical protein HZS55_10145 [Halosimplex rubrum]
MSAVALAALARPALARLQRAWVAGGVVGVSQAILSGLSSGVFLAVAVFAAVHVLSRGSVEGGDFG